MPQKYRIQIVRSSSDKLLTGYFFHPDTIHRDYNGTRDGRFYSKADALACLNNCYLHYKSRYDAALEDDCPIFDGHYLIIGRAIITISKCKQNEE